MRRSIRNRPIFILAVFALTWVIAAPPSVFATPSDAAPHDTTQPDTLCSGLSEAIEQLRDPGLLSGRSEQIRKAVSSYHRALNSESFCEEEISLLEREILLAGLISKEFGPDEVSGQEPEAKAAALSAFWDDLAPVPSRAINERLIEHQQRVAEAERWFGGMVDDALARIYIRYGDPDVTHQTGFDFRRSELFGFMSDFESAVSGFPTTNRNSGWRGEENGEETAAFMEEEDESRVTRTVPVPSFRNRQWDAKWRTDELEERIAANPFRSDLKVWIYRNAGPDRSGSLIVYFAGDETNGFREISAPDEWIPSGLYRRLGNLSVAPALPIQYLLYAELSRLDRSIMHAFNQLEREIFNRPVAPTSGQLAQLATSIRTNHTQTGFLRRAQAEPSRSSISEIPFAVHPYRSVTPDGRPVWIAFLEADAGQLLASHSADERSDIRWFFEQGADLVREDRSLAGRLRNRPAPGEDGVIRTIFEIPQPDGNPIVLRLYTGIYAANGEEASEDHQELKGAGRTDLQLEERGISESELYMGDLILGIGREEAGSELRFPYIPSHERIIPEGRSPVIHFDLYGLEQGASGKAEFEAEYRIEPEERRRSRLFRRSRSGSSGTISFETTGRHFSESIELDNLGLRPGRYQLHFSVRDMNSGQIVEEVVGLVVVEREF